MDVVVNEARKASIGPLAPGECVALAQSLLAEGRGARRHTGAPGSFPMRQALAALRAPA